jgi:hypothetical protein
MLKPVHIFLSSDTGITLPVIASLRQDVQYFSDFKKIEVRKCNPGLDTSQ